MRGSENKKFFTWVDAIHSDGLFWLIDLYCFCPVVEYFTHIGMSPLSVKGYKKLASVQYLWAGWPRSNYNAIPMTQNLGLQDLLQRPPCFEKPEVLKT